jgi:DNA-binding beta-propeller fold protein YncE
MTDIRTIVGRAALAGLLGCSLFLGACATTPSLRGHTPGVHLQWPPPPDPAKVVWVREVSDFKDTGITKGLWSRVLELVGGVRESGIIKPYGLYIDEQDRLYVVDSGRATVHIMDTREGRFTMLGEDTGVFLTPIGITGDGNGNVYITDSSAGVIYRYNYREKLLHPFGTLNLGRPTGIAFNRSNRLLYVSDTTSHQVVVFDLKGTERLRIGERGEKAGQFNFPTDLFIDGKGRLHVTDALNFRVQMFSADGAFLKMFGQAGDTAGNFAKPKGVALDSEGHVYVCDALLDAVQVFNDAGALLLEFGGHGRDPGMFWMPSGLYIDKDDYIFVADTFNSRIQVFRYIRTGGAPPAEPDAKTGK